MNDAELELRLRRMYRAVAAGTATLDREDEDDREDRDHREDRHDDPAPVLLWPRRRSRIAIRVAAAAVVLLAGALLYDYRYPRVERPPDEPEVDPDALATGSLVGTWEAIPAAPIATNGPGSVWTGSELVVFGGSGGSGTTSAAYDPAGRSWRALAALPGELEGAGLGVWTGSQIVAFRAGTSGVAGLYDLASDTWRLLESGVIPELDDDQSYVLWTGDRVLLAGVPVAAGDDGGEGAVLYDPVADSWQRLPDAPQPLGPSGDAVWTGHEMLWVGRDAVSDTMAALALDPATQIWRVLPTPPLVEREAPLVAWSGSELVVAGGVRPPDAENPDGEPLDDAAVFDPFDSVWREYPDPPDAVDVSGNEVASAPTVAVVGTRLVAFSSRDSEDRPRILNLVTGTWRYGRPAPDSPDQEDWHRVVVSTGSSVLVWGTTERPLGQLETVGYVYTP